MFELIVGAALICIAITLLGIARELENLNDKIPEDE